MRRLILPGVAMLMLAGCEPAPTTSSAADSVRPARLMEVNPASTERSHQFVGRVEAAQTVDMSFQVGGLLQQLPVREGQTIAAGDLVAGIDPVDYRLAVREAEVEMQLAEQDYDRKQSLVAQRAVAQSAVDDALSQLRLRRVRLEQARENLRDTRISAPFDAYVARRFTDSHVNVRAGDPMVRLLDLQELYVVANVPENLLATARPERVISIDARFDFAPDRTFPLEIRENSGEAESVAQTYEVTFAMQPSDDWNILPGMTATVDVRLSDPLTLEIHVPGSALVSNSAGEFQVWVYDPETGLVEPRVVKASAPEEDGVPVTGGLSGGEFIVVTGASLLAPGMRIRPLGDIARTR